MFTLKHFSNISYKLFFLATFFILSLSNSYADTEKTQIEFFGRETCVHCIEEKAFLSDMKNKYPQIKVNYYDIETPDGKELFYQVVEKAELSKTTPLTFVGNTFLQGFGSSETTGKQIEQLIQASLLKDTYSIQDYIALEDLSKIESVLTGSTCPSEPGSEDEDCEVEDYTYLVDVPIFGAIDLKAWSLPTMSIVLGFIDGFNPCAMWVLIMFLLALMQVGSKTRMFQVAGIFIFAEAIMYYLILNVWITTWNFVGLDKYVTPLIGIVAIGGGVFFLYEAYTSDGTCKVTNSKQQKKISEQIKELSTSPMSWAVFFGIIGLAFSVNIIEFACSIGIPQAFTKILEINFLTFFETQMYMLLYILFYMIDDFIVFGIALYSFEKLGIMQKYTKYTNFIGGVLMLIIGLLMIFSPQLLIFIK